MNEKNENDILHRYYVAVSYIQTFKIDEQLL